MGYERDECHGLCVGLKFKTFVLGHEYELG